MLYGLYIKEDLEETCILYVSSLRHHALKTSGLFDGRHKLQTPRSRFYGPGRDGRAGRAAWILTILLGVKRMF